MAVRKPLYYISDPAEGLREMNATDITEIVEYCKWAYAVSPSVALSAGQRTGEWTTTDLGDMVDSRMTAGEYRSFTTRFPNESETFEPGSTTVTWHPHMLVKNQANSHFQTRARVDNRAVRTYPVYWDGTGIRPMTQQDMYDTFYETALDEMADGTDQNGTFRIYATSSQSDSLWSGTLPTDLVGDRSGLSWGAYLPSIGVEDPFGSGSTPNKIFGDTRANTGAYTAGSIREALDQPTTINSYYIMQVYTGDTPPTTKKMLQMDSSGDLQQYKLTRMPHFQSGTNGVSEDTSYLQALITTDMQAYASYKSPDKKLRYILSTNGTPSTGNARGSSMVDTKLNGSGNYQTRYVNTDDYRAQEFPNGSPVTQNTYTIRIYHA